MKVVCPRVTTRILTPRILTPLILTTLLAALAGPGSADEGQWMPSQIDELDVGELRRTGFQLTPRQLWADSDRHSLLRAVVNLSGCTAAFLSEAGLVGTNHHCAYRAVQAASSVEHDYLTHGFLAKTPAQEIEAKGLTVKVLEAIRDVTAEVLAAGEGAADDAARAAAIEKKQKEIVAACEASKERTCQVASFYRGSFFQLFEQVELTDVRIVYAPESSVGSYGGEVDNWMWPRHTGDFTLLRAYVGKDGKPAPYSAENVPYRPRRHLEVSAEGAAPGRFVATVGYPGRTHRYLSSDEVARHTGQVLPTLIDLYGEWIGIQQRLVEEAGATGRAAKDARRLKVAGRLKLLQNRHKNARGMIEGVERMKLLERRQEDDRALAALARERGAPFAEVPAALHALSEAQRAHFPRAFLLEALPRGPDVAAVAIDLVRWARERPKADLDRAEGYQDRDRERLWRGIERHLGSFDPVVDEALLASWLGRLAAVDAEEAAPGGAAPGEAPLSPAPAKFDASKIVKSTTLFTPGRARALFDAADLAALTADADPALAFALAVVAQIEEEEAEGRRQRGQELLHGPRYFELLKEVRKGPVYPDANGTLRFSYATVTGYSPKDGILAATHTTLAGQVAKHTGAEPFDLPGAVREKAASAASTYWADPDLGDVPVCFLTSSDTTGGNSGSPVIDGKGRLVGFNFDRVWENIAGDFAYNPRLSRNIVADVRYMLWLLDDVHGADALLDELGVAPYRDLPRRRPPSTVAIGAPGLSPQLPGNGCAATDASAANGSTPWVMGLALSLAVVRRRRRSQL